MDWFHFTGITPALGPNVVEICKEACKAAKAHNVKISCDLNYRGKLWTREQARAAMTELCQYVDVCISNEEDAKDVFGIEAENTDIYGGELNHEGYKSVAKQLADKFGFEKVAITLRESHSAFDNGWSAMLYDVKSGEYCFSKKYELHIIDRVGGGDSFGGSHIVMSCKQLRGDMNYAWPTAEIAVMGGAGAVEVLYAKEAKASDDPAKVLQEKEAEYNKLFCNPYNAARYGYIDDVIEPRNTRFRVIRALQQLATKKVVNPAKKHGNIPL